MKIKLALLDSDQKYLSRIVNAFNTKYSEKFEIYSFTKYENALAELERSHIDILVASDYFDVDVSKLPKRCGFAYFVETADIDTVNNQRAICKFQKADLIYRQILSIYSENASVISGLKLTDDSCKVIAFTSPCGGAGSSVMAASCALHYALQSKKTLYLNFEKLGSSDSYFKSDGQFDISDIIFALKSKNSNLTMKMESCVKQDPRGVYFFSGAKIALDMLELGSDEIIRVVNDAKLSGNYSYIILDIDFGMKPDYINILKQTNAVIWTGDGSEISNMKIKRAYDALSILDKNTDAQLLNRTLLIYNKFSNKCSTAVQDVELKNIGGAPRYEHATTAQVLEQLMNLNMFDMID